MVLVLDGIVEYIPCFPVIRKIFDIQTNKSSGRIMYISNHNLFFIPDDVYIDDVFKTKLGNWVPPNFNYT